MLAARSALRSSSRRLAPAVSLRHIAPAVRYSSNVRTDPGDFHELRERSLLRHTIKKSKEGDADSVLGAMDEFWDTYYNGKHTVEWKLRSKAVDEAVKAKSPQAFLELGTYCGYSAVRIGRLLPPGAKLISVEIDPLYAAIATKARVHRAVPPRRRHLIPPLRPPQQVVEHAGLSDSVKIEIGSLSEKIDAIGGKHALKSLDGVLMDHGPSEYVPDLKLLEERGLIKEDTAALACQEAGPASGGADTPSREARGRAGASHLRGWRVSTAWRRPPGCGPDGRAARRRRCCATGPCTRARRKTRRRRPSTRSSWRTWRTAAALPCRARRCATRTSSP